MGQKSFLRTADRGTDANREPTPAALADGRAATAAALSSIRAWMIGERPPTSFPMPAAALATDSPKIFPFRSSVRTDRGARANREPTPAALADESPGPLRIFLASAESEAGPSSG